MLLLPYFLCRRARRPLTKGIITVYDSEGNTVSGAIVKLYQEDIVGVTQTNVVSTLVSDFNGQTEHVLELEALMNVEAYTLSESASADTSYGTTVIRLMRGKTIYKNIEILHELVKVFYNSLFYHFILLFSVHAWQLS